MRVFLISRDNIVKLEYITRLLVGKYVSMPPVTVFCNKLTFGNYLAGDATVAQKVIVNAVLTFLYL